MIFYGSELYLLKKDGSFIPADIFNKNITCEEGHAYMKNNFVYIYHGKFSDYKENLNPGIYLKNSGYIIEPYFNKKDAYTIDDIRQMDAASIFEDITSNAHKYDKQMNTVESLTTIKGQQMPLLLDTDDFLKSGIKRAIIGKDVDVRIYKNKLPGKNELTNKYSSIKSNTTKVTVPVFKEWIDLLNLDCKIVISDNGKDHNNPLHEDIVIDLKDY